MIDFERLEAEAAACASRFKDAKPFPHIVLDGFLHAAGAMRLVQAIPDPSSGSIRRSRDYVFAKNKFEKSHFKDISPDFARLYADLTSARFAEFLSTVTGEEVFLDVDFHGGGLHQGGVGSFLDMHVDFNFHPLHDSWFRNLNVLIYLNPDWKPEYGGQLKLRHKQTGEHCEVDPIMNRCVIMLTRDYTLHGYDPISFPQGQYRRSLAAYAYSLHHGDRPMKRSTTWYPERGGPMKAAVGRLWPKLVRIKNAILGSSTEKNR